MNSFEMFVESCKQAEVGCLSGCVIFARNGGRLDVLNVELMLAIDVVGGSRKFAKLGTANVLFLDAFAILRNRPLASSCPSVRMEQLGSQ
jgi:hypothetical protein